MGIVVTDPAGDIVCRGGAFIGTATNNVAEYEAIIWGMRVAAAYGAATLRVFSDSELIIRQMRGEYRVKNAGLKPLFSSAQALVRAFGSVDFVHVPRAENADADALANEAMDARATVGNAPCELEPTSTSLF